MNEKETHECTACKCEFSEDEGGIRGYFGMLYMAFCPTCYACIWDMVDQQKEWIGLTDDDIKVLAKKHNGIFYDCDIDFAKAIETKLKEKNA